MVGDVLAGRYELEQLVGAGGMSTVFRAHDRVLERTVALKVLHQQLTEESEYLERFRREARMVAGLSHQNIVNVIDRDQHDGIPFIVFEYVDGENLKQLVGREGPLPIERALELSIQVAHGLAFAHESGFVHRDVKPQNVLLHGNGEAKVTDFGIARSLVVESGVTQTGTVLGSSDYIAPEQAQGRPVDERTDIYSLGVVLYELLTGAPPFSGDNFVAVAMQHINEPPPPVSLRRPEVPARVEAAIDRALAKTPRERFASMAEFARELEACLEEVRVGSDVSPTGVMPAVSTARRPPPVRRPRRRSRVVPALVAVAVAIGAVVLAVALTGGGRGKGTGGGAGPSATVTLRGVASYDPYGDRREHPELVGEATDGNASTAWETERYRDAPSLSNKPGVGLVLDAGRTVTLNSLTVTTRTPGYSAVIQAGGTAGGPFHAVSASETVAARTTFELRGAKARYFVIWITRLGAGFDRATVSEVVARS